MEGGTEMVNAPDIGGSTGLHKAASQGNEKMLELLLGGGADVKGADNEVLLPFISFSFSLSPYSPNSPPGHYRSPSSRCQRL